jgi:hypothetical protein
MIWQGFYHDVYHDAVPRSCWYSCTRTACGNSYATNTCLAAILLRFRTHLSRPGAGAESCAVPAWPSVMAIGHAAFTHAGLSAVWGPRL